MRAVKPSVLLVDPDSDYARSLAKTLIRAGFVVNTADDVSEAMGVLESKRFTALVLGSGPNPEKEKDLLKWARNKRIVDKTIVMDIPGSAFLEDVKHEKAADLTLTKAVDKSSLVKFLAEQIPSSQESESFSGNIEGVDILSYVQFILLSGTKAVLEIYSRDGARGTVYVNNGSICHASTGTLGGELALYRCLSFRGGNVLTRKWREPEKTTIDKPGDFLLFEAARQRDECLEG
jgi:ActR/RegA family two-component response regulator